MSLIACRALDFLRMVCTEREPSSGRLFVLSDWGCGGGVPPLGSFDEKPCLGAARIGVPACGSSPLVVPGAATSARGVGTQFPGIVCHLIGIPGGPSSLDTFGQCVWCHRGASRLMPVAGVGEDMMAQAGTTSLAAVNALWHAMLRVFLLPVRNAREGNRLDAVPSSSVLTNRLDGREILAAFRTWDAYAPGGHLNRNQVRGVSEGLQGSLAGCPVVENTGIGGYVVCFETVKLAQLVASEIMKHGNGFLHPTARSEIFIADLREVRRQVSNRPKALVEPLPEPGGQFGVQFQTHEPMQRRGDYT